MWDPHHGAHQRGARGSSQAALPLNTKPTLDQSRLCRLHHHIQLSLQSISPTQAAARTQSSSPAAPASLRCCREGAAHPKHYQLQ